MQDIIENTIVLNAPLSRVWRAISTASEFGTWFRVNLDGEFVVGESNTGHITYPGYEHMLWYSAVVAMEPKHRFVIDWPLISKDNVEELAAQAMTRVEFTLTEEGAGTRLTITESSFKNLPDTTETVKAYEDNIEGWQIQRANIRAYVEG